MSVPSSSSSNKEYSQLASADEYSNSSSSPSSSQQQQQQQQQKANSSLDSLQIIPPHIEQFEIDDSQVLVQTKNYLNSTNNTETTLFDSSRSSLSDSDEEDHHESSAFIGSSNNNNNNISTQKAHKIKVPTPQAPKPSKTERTIGYIMSLGKVTHGLTGKPLLYFTTVFVSLGVFLFGYDQGVMSGIITSPYFLDYFNQPSRAEIGTMVAILEIGALISSVAVGRVGDIIGRRRTILYGSLIFVLGGMIQTCTLGIKTMIFGRFISGIGVGFLSTIVPVYQSEISPPHNRGKLACIEFTGNIVGYSSSVWVDYASSFIESDVSWRLPLGLQCVMGSLLFLGSFIIVETPRWLLDHDHDDEGMIVIANLHGGGDIHHPLARQEFREIKESVYLQRLEGERSYLQMWKKYKKRVLIAMSSQMFAQLNGINVISYYAPLVFEQAGWVGRQAILMTGINSLVYILSTIPPWYLSDRWGRRFILMSGAIVMGISLSLISYFMYLAVPYTPQAVVGLVIIYNAFFGYSWGPIPWLYPPEILPLNVRAKGASLSTASNWLFNFIVGEMTPILQETITWRLYLIHAFSCICSFICVYFAYPETMGVNLEDMGSLFGDKSIASTISSSSNSYLDPNYGHHNDNRSDTQSLLSKRSASLRPDSPLLQPSAASIARGTTNFNPNVSRSRSNSNNLFSPLNSNNNKDGVSVGGGFNATDAASILNSTADDNQVFEDDDYDNEDNNETPKKKTASTVSGILDKVFKNGNNNNKDDEDLESGNKPLLPKK